MPRFLGFHRRKSTATAEDIENAKGAVPSVPSFRVLDRNEVAAMKTYEEGARSGRPYPVPPPAPTYRADSFAGPDGDNMFVVLKAKDRGSGSSNTTKTISTDNSSRLSDISTTPSSADLHEEIKPVPRKQQYADIPIPPLPMYPPSGFFKNAGRTFSFGTSKKSPSPPISPEPKQDEWQDGDKNSRSRAMTASTSVTVSSASTTTPTPPRLDDDSLDMGHEFGTNMFKGLAEKRASMLMPLPGDTFRTDSRPIVPAPLQIDKSAKVEPSPHSWNSQTSNDELLNGSAPTSVPGKWDSKGSPDDESSLLTDSLLASRWLGGHPDPPTANFTPESIPMTDMQTTRSGPQPDAAGADDNLFSTVSSTVRPAHRFPPKPTSAQNKVMTPAQFEKYRQDKVREDTHKTTNNHEEDNYDYDDDEEQEKARKLAKDRKRQQAHMTLYRQQMTKVVGESSSSSSPSLGLPTFGSTSNLIKSPSPELVLEPDEDEDEDIPLAILSAHNFPSKARPPIKPVGGTNQYLRASYLGPAPRPQSSLGGEMQRNNRYSALPAFARNLPQDPFSNGNISQPAIREALPFAGGLPSPQPHMGPGGQMPVGGLVGVIMNEERSRAMRRGSPQPQAGKFGSTLLGHDPALSMPQQVMPPPSHMMYGMNPVAAMSQPSLSQSGYGQTDMMQMQMQLMQMQMAQIQMLQGGGMGAPMSPGMSGMPGMQIPRDSGTMMRQSLSDVSLGMRHSVAADSARDMPRPDVGMRTMSMVQPSSASWIQPASYAPSIRIQGAGYTPSIAPSERSNIGMPGRYRPVSQAMPSHDAKRVSTMSGALTGWDAPGQRGSKVEPRLSVGGISNSNSGSISDDEDEGWGALKARKEKTRSMWRTKKLSASSIMSGIL